jgi:hypothetical protein
MIFAENGLFLTFTAKDTGLADKEGNFIYMGAMIFDSNERLQTWIIRSV